MRPIPLVGVLSVSTAFLSFCGAAITRPTSLQYPPGFVTTNGRQFELDGKPFVSLQFAGPLCISDRCYWIRHSSERILTCV